MTDSLPKLSVVVPVYNSGGYLRVCLASLAAQDCEGIEFICVNDGSTDGSPDELDAQAAAEKNVIFGGRLAEYRYYDMAPVIEQVLNHPEVKSW